MGGAAFPDLVVILQGEGVRIDLTGNTFISHGITSSTFGAVPDAPISSFELNLPQGPHSALTTNLPTKTKGSLCASKLVMPTTITAQNGAQVKQSTRIAVAGLSRGREEGQEAQEVAAGKQASETPWLAAGAGPWAAPAPDLTRAPEGSSWVAQSHSRPGRGPGERKSR